MSDPATPRRQPTAMDVARLAGVSQSAVSRAFTPGASIAPETKRRITEAARDLGYRPNALARSLITRRSRIVAVAMAYLDNSFYPFVLEMLSARLKDLGYQVLLFTAARDRAADPRLEDILRYQAEAVVLASTTLSSDLADECRAAGIPVVQFNRVSADSDASSVTGDNAGGGAAIAEFLVAGGHRRFGFLAGMPNASTNRDRRRGFEERLAALGMAAPRIAVGDYDFHGATRAMTTLLSAPERPDAVFVANDHMAIAALEVARHDFGLSVPDDLSIVGFDDVGPAAWRSISLTTYSQPLTPMVEATVDLLVERLAEPGSSPLHRVVAGELVVRGSAREPPGVFEVDGRRLWRPPAR